MKVAIAPGVHVYLGTEDIALIELVQQGKINLVTLDESSWKRLKSLLSKGIVRRSKQQGQIRYEVRRNIFD